VGRTRRFDLFRLTTGQYAVESQINYHRLNPSESLVFLRPRAGEALLRVEDIVEVIESEGSSIALILLSGVQYYTGQCFEIEPIVRAAHAKVSV
jgi:kynureninase